MSKLSTILLFLTFLLSTSFVCAQQGESEVKPHKTKILFLLDGSNSMLAEWEGGLRIDMAKKLLSELIDSLKGVDNLELAFRAYGHQHDRKKKNCTDTKLEVPFSVGNHDDIKAKLKKVTPKGVTPLAYSLEQATTDFEDPLNSRNIIIIITDGLESCNGDPCAISLALQKKNIFLKPFVIGIGMDENFTNQFSCIGSYYNATDTATFKKVLNRVVLQTLASSKIRVDLLDIYGEPTETNVNMTFINRFTGQTEYDFVHKLDNEVPEAVDIDPVLSYDIRVNTIPPVWKENVELTKSGLNIVKIPTPQGALHVSQRNHHEYGTYLPVIVRKKGEKETLYMQHAEQSELYLVGLYDIEVLTLPRTIFEGVRVQQSYTTTLQIASPGRLSVYDPINGYCSMYKVNEDESETWIYNFENTVSRATVPMQPGKYKIVYRAEKAKSNSYTTVQYFTIQSGKITTVKLLKS